MCNMVYVLFTHLKYKQKHIVPTVKKKKYCQHKIKDFIEVLINLGCKKEFYDVGVLVTI